MSKAQWEALMMTADQMRDLIVQVGSLNTKIDTALELT